MVSAKRVVILCLVVVVATLIAPTNAKRRRPKCDQDEDSSKPNSNSSRPRIIGGSLAAEGDFPFFVKLVAERKSGDKRKEYCAGVIVAKQYILTNAFCAKFRNEDGDFESYDKFSVVGIDTREVEAAKYRVEEAIVHPDFLVENDEVSYDVALLKLESPLELGPDADEPTNKVSLPDAKAKYELNSEAKVCGTGAIKQKPGERPKLSGKLHCASLKMADTSDCRKQVKDQEGVYATSETDVCTGFKSGKSSAAPCVGDLGAPLMRKNKKGKWELVGLVSRPIRNAAMCEQAGTYYTRVARLVRWIEDYI